jgi:DNA-binding beta-propeller fold protein YncE
MRLNTTEDLTMRKFAALVLVKILKYALVISCVGMLAASGAIKPTPLALPGGESGIGFDDMGFAPSIHKVLVPAGRSGNLDLIDPDTKQVTAIGGFSSRSSFGGGHGQGVTSADEGRGLLFATDRDARQLKVVDPKTQSVITTAPLAAGPDYVRYVSTTGEIWVTEPGAARIEVFSAERRSESGSHRLYFHTRRPRISDCR